MRLARPDDPDGELTEVRWKSFRRGNFHRGKIGGVLSFYYSYLRANIGSTFAARNAGSAAAKSASATMITAAMHSVSGS
jgi:hypothetical protein